ncbi:MAG: hypothetical protein WC822_05720 [Candidatus Paceibacterota bacterium]|jgi:hypothetical protein
MNLGYWDESDYYHKNAPVKKTKWQFFTAYILPWLFLGAICIGIYFVFLYGLEAIILISEPLSEGMKKAGL